MVRNAIILAVVLPLSGCLKGCPGTVSVPALTLRVVDAESHRPLAGMSVAYGLECGMLHGRFLGIIPSPNPTLGFKLVHRRRTVTDASGEAVFGPYALRLAGNEEVVGEILLINTRVDTASSLAMETQRTLEADCREGSPTCSGKPTELDVAWRNASSEADRREVLRAVQVSHRGEVLFIFPRLYEPAADGRQPGEVGLRHLVSERAGPEVVEVHLRRME